jgi:hypothetical protein
VSTKPGQLHPDAFVDLIAREKLAARYAQWSWRSGVDKELLGDLAATQGVPRAVKQLARERLEPLRQIAAHTYVEEMGVRRLLSREELYELVWSEPLLTLSRKFGLSDNGLRKRCKAMNVPTPKRGYWQRGRRTGRSGRPPLPPMT